MAKLYVEVDHEIQQPLGCKLLSFEFASPDQVRSLEPILLITESSRRSVFPQGMSDLEIKRPLSLRHVRGNPSRSRDIERVPTLLCQPHALDDFLPAYHDVPISHFQLSVWTGGPSANMSSQTSYTTLCIHLLTDYT